MLGIDTHNDDGITFKRMLLCMDAIIKSGSKEMGTSWLRCMEMVKTEDGEIWNDFSDLSFTGFLGKWETIDGRTKKLVPFMDFGIIFHPDKFNCEVEGCNYFVRTKTDTPFFYGEKTDDHEHVFNNAPVYTTGTWSTHS